MLQGMGQALGEAAIRERIDAAFGRYGVFRFRATVSELPNEGAPELVQIGPGKRREGHHGDGL
jgi:hypothetical protein